MDRRKRNIIRRYLESNIEQLEQAYIKPSQDKINHFNSVRKACEKLGGFRLRLISYNKYTFTTAYLANQNEKLYLIYTAPYETIAILMPEEFQR